jgi:hypothetical protein
MPPIASIRPMTIVSARQQGDNMSDDHRSTYNESVSRSAAEGYDEEKARLEELRALVRYGLGFDLEATTFSALAEIQNKLRAKQVKFQSKQETGDISPEQYLARVSSAMEQFERQASALLGRRQYEAIFGDAGGSEKIIDDETYLAQAGR